METLRDSTRYTGFDDINGNAVYTESYVQMLREEDKKGRLKNHIFSQRGGQTNMLSSNADITIGGGSRGGPLVVDTRVVTPFGYRRIGDLKAGDIISGTDGGMQRVVYRKNHGLLPCYRLKFIDGSEVVASYDHLWNVAYRGSENYFVCTTQSIAEAVKNGSCLHIPICRPVKYLGYDDNGLFQKRMFPVHQMFGYIEERRRLLRKETLGFTANATSSLDLANDIKQLADSLGWLATITEEGDHYIIDIDRDNPKRYIVKCEYVGEKECCCIAVDNTDSLFMVEDFVVTHNSKSFSILLDGLYDISNPHFEGIIFRKEKPDLRNIINDSKTVYRDYGTYISSEKDMRWDLKAGGHIRFSYYADSYDDFKDRMQGQQFSYLAIDEITQIEFEKFKYLMTDVRNAHKIRNRIFGTCNPDHRSWVRVFIDWWIGKADTIYNDPSNGLVGLHPERKGLPIPERDGKVRYCFMAGATTPADIVWGDTREEVYDQCKGRIDDFYKKGGYEAEGNPADIFILSVCFTEAKLKDNKKLIESDPSYIARLANQDEEQIARDLEGNWDYERINDDYLSTTDMEDFFNRPPDFGDNVMRAAGDVAFQGGDNNWMWLMRGNCIIDVDVCQLDAQDNINHVREKLKEWGVREENFAFDQNGVGQAYKGFFKRSVPFNNQEAPYAQDRRDLEIVREDHDTLKSQCAYNLADAIRYGEITIARHLLDRRFSGKGFENLTLREIMMQERRFFNVDEGKRDRGKGRCLAQKSEIKKWLHRSPDCMESLTYLRIFWVKKTTRKRGVPRGAARFVRYTIHQ